MRPGRRSRRELFWDLYKSVILNELLCAAAKGWICKEALPRILGHCDSSCVANGCFKLRELEDARTSASEEVPSRGAASFSEHIGCTRIPSMFYIFYRASKEGLWKCER